MITFARNISVTDGPLVSSNGHQFYAQGRFEWQSGANYSSPWTRMTVYPGGTYHHDQGA